MRSSEGRGPTSQHLKVTVPCGSAIFKREGASGGPLHTKLYEKRLRFMESSHDKRHSSHNS